MIVRWICEKDNKKWIYPVEKCAYCKGPIKKQIGSKIKVVGITKVMIPSPMHPIIPYNIILLQDEFGNRLPKKTMKDFKIGDAYIEEKAKTGNAVSTIKIKYDAYEAIKHSLDLINFKVNKEDKILIKPSAVTAAYSYQAVNTNPEIVAAVIKHLLELGVPNANILVAEQALIGSDSMDAAAKSGILEICKKNDITFADISKGPFSDVEQDGFKFKVFSEALSRHVINVPVMKTNFQLIISGALENLTRFLSPESQRELYQKDFDKGVSALSKVVKKITNIGDCSNGMQAQGPLSAGEPAFMNLILASSNAVVIDKAFCDIFMLDTPTYVFASTDGLDLSKTEYLGSELDALRYPILHAVPNETPHPDIKVKDAKGCPACVNMMYNITSRLVGLRGDQINIIIGNHFDETDLKMPRVVAMGDCAIKKLEEMKNEETARIDEKTDPIEQLLFMKKLLTTKGTPKITNVDKVKSKMKKLLSKVA